MKNNSPYLWFVVTALLGSAPLTCIGQQRSKGPNLMDSVPARDRAKVEGLGDLGSLSADNWRFHAGDVPHGESVALDDHDWPMAPPKTTLGAGAVWLRQRITIPSDIHGYDVSGAQILFSLRAASDSNVPEIVYVNGNRVALGEELEPVTLFASAHAGDTVLIAVKLLPTSSPKRLQGTVVHVVPADTRPDPATLQAEIMMASSLIPVLSADKAHDAAVVEKAIAQIDESALAKHNAAAFDRSLREAETTLSVLKPLLRKVTFHETGNSHIDAAWLWPVSETVDVVKRTFGSALQLMDEYPQYTFSQSAAQYNEWIADKYPDMNAEIRKRIQQGRWEVLGGMWVEPDLNLPDGESIVRSLLLGKRFYQKQYGVDVRIGWNPDTFGYNWQMPQIYKRSGIDYFVTQKLAWSDTNTLPLKLFWWQSPDGSKVLTYFPNDYANTDLNPVRMTREYLRTQAMAPGLEDMMDLYGVGDHGGGATRTILDEGVHWSAADRVAPVMQFGTASSYFEAVKPQIASASRTWDYRSIAQGYTFPTPAAPSQISVPTWKDELYLEFHRGTYTTQANHKLGIRTAERETLDAEKFASLAYLDGVPYPNDEFTTSWQKITFNQFHDLAAGSGIAVIYRDAQKDFDLVHKNNASIEESSLAALDARIDTRGKGVPLVVWNTLTWPREGLVTAVVQMPAAANALSVLDSAGKAVPSEVLGVDAATHTYSLRMHLANVPAMGYTVLHVVAGAAEVPSGLSLRDTTLENRFLRVTIDPGNGCITSILDKTANQEALADGACGGELQAFADNPKVYDAWEIQPGTLDVAPALLRDAAEVKPLPSPVRPAVQVRRTWRASTFLETISLGPDSRAVRIDSEIDWHEQHTLLKAAFKLRHTAPQATFEIPYGAIQRPTTRANSWEKARFEVSAIRWADLGDAQFGVSLLNDSKYGYDALGDTLRLSLLRGATSPDPDADQGKHHTAYAIYPHAGTWQSAGTVRQGYDFNQPMTAHQAAPHEGMRSPEQSFAESLDPNDIITAIKKDEDSHALVVRLYDASGQGGTASVRVPAGASSVAGVLLTEMGADPDVHPVLDHDRITVAMKPFQIVTLMVTYPLK